MAHQVTRPESHKLHGSAPPRRGSAMTWGDTREIGDEALSWELTSAKSGHGVQQLRDDNVTTFWQSDGSVPHKVTILFHKKQMIQNLAIYTDHQLDESYTPQDIVVKASTSSLHNYETHIVAEIELNEPTGWVPILCRPHKRQNQFDKFLKTDKLIIEIRTSHQSGRDTHIRQIKIFAPQSGKLYKNEDESFLFDYKMKAPKRRDMEQDDRYQDDRLALSDDSHSVMQMIPDSIR